MDNFTGFTFSSPDNKELFRITADNEVILQEGVELSDAAQAFWDAVRNLRGEKDLRLYDRDGKVVCNRYDDSQRLDACVYEPDPDEYKGEEE